MEPSYNSNVNRFIPVTSNNYLFTSPSTTEISKKEELEEKSEESGFSSSLQQKTEDNLNNEQIISKQLDAQTGETNQLLTNFENKLQEKANFTEVEIEALHEEAYQIIEQILNSHHPISIKNLERMYTIFFSSCLKNRIHSLKILD